MQMKPNVLFTAHVQQAGLADYGQKRVLLEFGHGNTDRYADVLKTAFEHYLDERNFDEEGNR